MLLITVDISGGQALSPFLVLLLFWTINFPLLLNPVAVRSTMGIILRSTSETSDARTIGPCVKNANDLFPAKDNVVNVNDVPVGSGDRRLEANDANIPQARR